MVGWWEGKEGGCGPVVKWLPTMHKTWDPISRITKRDTNLAARNL